VLPKWISDAEAGVPPADGRHFARELGGPRPRGPLILTLSDLGNTPSIVNKVVRGHVERHVSQIGERVGQHAVEISHEGFLLQTFVSVASIFCMMSNERFIAGIYNYCDYWCERCAFTKRCRNFVMGREVERTIHGEEPVDDATRESFWNQLADQLRETSIFGRAGGWADDIGDDFDYEPDPEYEARQEALARAVDEHPLTTLAHSYMMKVDAWLKSADGDLKAFARELTEAAGSPFDQTDYEEQARQTGEMIEVIAWYHTLLPQKVGRAVRGALESKENESMDGELAEILAESRQDDANGSGKLALVSIERSAAAWVRMRDIVPRREDEILEMLVILSRLKRRIHAALPGARSFVRPGLDE
jgi:hypothetical protein